MLDQRKLFMRMLEEEDSPGVAALCREFGISRNTAYKWIARYRLDGLSGLTDLSRAAHNHPNQIDCDIEQMVIDTRRKYPSWGARKVLRWLQDHGGAHHWPCLASISAIMERSQLVRSRRKRRLVEPFAGDLTAAVQPNDLWCIDHKGWWLAGNGDKCEPFTITDQASRFLIRCVLRRGKGIEHVLPVLTAAFHEYGLPVAIRSDNGAPFASRAPLGLSQLSVWFTRLGIEHQRIDAGKPQQNGSHERMHLTMLQDRSVPIAGSLRLEQKRLADWQQVFNYERPHEALGLDTPASHYHASARTMPLRLPAFDYPATMQVRKVDSSGMIGWKAKGLSLTEALSGQHLGFEPNDIQGIWTMWLATRRIGSFDEKRFKVTWAKSSAPAKAD